MVIDHRRGVADPVVALTFDDGPSEWTVPVLEHLARHDARATFFTLGAYVEARPDVVRRIRDQGCEVGNHTYSHPRLGEADEEVVAQELSRTSWLIEETIGFRPSVWRAPYLSWPAAESSAFAMGMSAIGCNVVPGDWEQGRTAHSIAEHVLAEVQPGDIVLLHDGRPPHRNDPSAPTREETAGAVGLILSGLAKRGLRAVTVSELLSQTARAH
ncbi:MAG TPA: polysaccharide deacetylase family protein [Gaiellaceae bacterium]|nr:polysaccharide deacetylase family protein [Gaiellaceae bacterium]